MVTANVFWYIKRTSRVIGFVNIRSFTYKAIKQIKLNVMGNDGGSIPKRDELVKTKKKEGKADVTSQQIAAWFFCALSKSRLEPPIVADALGKLYNRVAILEFLLDKTSYGDGDIICSHIESIRDVRVLKLTPNPAYDSDKLKAGTLANLDEGIVAEFICPITMREMNGKHRFVYIDTCGCVLSEQVLKEVPSIECLSCGSPFTPDNVVIINPRPDEIEQMKFAMLEKKAKAKAEKKEKKKARNTNDATLANATTTTTSLKRKNSPDGTDMPPAKKPIDPKHLNAQSLSPASAVQAKVAQELAKRHNKKHMSDAVQGIFTKDKDKKPAGTWMTMGTFTRYA